MRGRRPVRYHRDRQALELGKLRLLLIERVARDLGLLAAILLVVLGLQAEAVPVAALSLMFTAQSRRS